MQTGSKELIRDINSHLILETILNEGPISRSAISQKLGLTKATVSTIVAELIEKKLVREVGNDDTSLGRKPILLEFSSENGHIISIDLGVNSITAFTSDLKGNDCGLKMYPNTYKRKTIINGLIGIIEESMFDLPVTPFGIVCISIGVHGTVFNNEISFTPYYDYAKLPIAEELERYFRLPVLLENEANLSVIGEKAFCYNTPNIVGLSVHSGIGVGIIINNRLFTGCNGNAGEFGHTIVEAGGIPCPCGNNGCIEQYASERAILNGYAEKMNIEGIDIDSFIAKYNEGDAVAVEMIEQFVKYISFGINNISSTLNPDVIVINSSFTIYIPGLLDEIKSQLKNRISQNTSLVPSGLQDISILLGGVCKCINNYLGVDYSAPNNTFVVG